MDKETTENFRAIKQGLLQAHSFCSITHYSSLVVNGSPYKYVFLDKTVFETLVNISTDLKQDENLLQCSQNPPNFLPVLRLLNKHLTPPI